MAAWKLILFQSHLLRHRRPELLDSHGQKVLDIDATMLVSFANKKEGASVGFNRKYKRHPCFQLSGCLMGKVFIDGKLFASPINPKEFFQKAVKWAIALGYRVQIVRADVAYLSSENMRFLLKRFLGYVLGAPARFTVVKEGILLFKQRARANHYSIIGIGKGVSAMDLGHVELQKGLFTRLVLLRKIYRRKSKRTGRWRVTTRFYAIATNLSLSVNKLCAFYHKRQTIESAFKELKYHYYIERLPVSHLKGNELFIICKILAMTLVKIFHFELLPKSLHSMMRTTLPRSVFQRGLKVENPLKVQVRSNTKYTWLLRRLIPKVLSMKQVANL